MTSKDFCCEFNVNSENMKFSGKCVQSKKLNKPTLNSTLRTRNHIEELQKTKCVNFHKKGTDFSKIPKLTTKLNFGTHQRVFGDLTAINVNDSIFLQKEKLPMRKKYTQSSDRIPTPDLHDFLDTLTSVNCVVEEPKIQIEVEEYNFDVMLYYKLLTE